MALVTAPCSVRTPPMTFWVSLMRSTATPIVGQGAAHPVDLLLDGPDLDVDLLGGQRGLVGQFLDLVGDDGEATAGRTGAGCLDGGVERDQVGLGGDALNDLDDLADLGA